MADGVSADVYAVFVDMMGFASALEALSDDEHRMLHECLLLSGRALAYSELAGDMGPRLRRAASLYCEFHFAINEWIQRATDYTRELKTFITFSDSVYVISESRNAAIVFAISMMRKAFTAHVPIRIGIGYGSFTRLAFSTVHHPSGALVAQSPFLGTAVIRAYRAERCGSPGFRIFVHPSAASEDPEKAWLLLTLEEPSDHCVQEVNYVNRRPPSPGLDDLLRDLAKMRRDASGTRALRHYDETERALKRLNAAGKTHRWDFRSEGPVEEL